MSVFLSVGNGVPCNTDDVGRAVTAFPLSEMEPVARDMAQSFSDGMNDAGVAHTTYFASCGIHDYPYFGEGLHRLWPQMLAAFGSSPPDAFDYRTTDATFSVWGWTFEADGGRGAEFLDVTSASCGGLTLHGSGLTKVTTASCFAPGSVVGLPAIGESAAVADAAGRITFSVDLGPAHDPTVHARRAAEGSGRRLLDDEDRRLRDIVIMRRSSSGL